VVLQASVSAGKFEQSGRPDREKNDGQA